VDIIEQRNPGRCQFLFLGAMMSSKEKLVKRSRFQILLPRFSSDFRTTSEEASLALAMGCVVVVVFRGYLQMEFFVCFFHPYLRIGYAQYGHLVCYGSYTRSEIFEGDVC